MRWIALVGPEIEENLCLRYLAACLARGRLRERILAFNSERDFASVAARRSRAATEPPLAVGLSLAFQWRAPDFLALAMALRERGLPRAHHRGRPLRDLRGRRTCCATSRSSTRSAARRRGDAGRAGRALAAGTPLARSAGLVAAPRRARRALTELPRRARPARRCRGPTAAASRRAASATASRRSCRAAAATRTAPSAASPRGTSRRCRASATALREPRRRRGRDGRRCSASAASRSSCFTTTTSSSPATARTSRASTRWPTRSRRAGHRALRHGGEGAARPT